MGTILNMGKVRPPDHRDVISKLERLLERARSGEVMGIMYVTLESDGKHKCASAGQYERNPTDGLVPALLGVINLCGQTGANE